MVYNALHATIGPAILAGIRLFLNDLSLGVTAIGGAPIGFDRMLGYDLKYAFGFGDAHLGRIGRARAGA
jgi:Domain of unknown function (DUF4260)